MQKILNDMIIVYKKMERDLYKKVVKTHNNHDLIAWYKVRAKIEVLDFLLWYLKEGELNG